MGRYYLLLLVMVGSSALADSAEAQAYQRQGPGFAWPAPVYGVPTVEPAAPSLPVGPAEAPPDAAAGQYAMPGYAGPGYAMPGYAPGITLPGYGGGGFRRPYPYHLDYYRLRYGGSYAPYFGNLYGPPRVYLPGYYGPSPVPGGHYW